MDYSKKSNPSRKCDRKQRRCQHIVEKEIGIKCTLTTSKNIAICNAGLVNGLTEENIYQHFVIYGVIDNITMVPGKSCCFVRYKDIDSATKAFENINGKLNIGQNNKPLYLSYVENIPQMEPRYQNEMPPGLIVIEDFIDETEENMLLELCNFNESEGNSMKHRQVKHFGYEFRYDINNVDKEKPLQQGIPSECEFLWQRLKLKEITFNPDQLTVNCYKPGQGIPAHIDTHSAFEDPIVSLSLGSSVVMNFKNGNLCYPIVLPRRSLTIMSLESRYLWFHGITPRKLDIVPAENDLTVINRSTRISYTFRKIRNGECNCNYFQHCDSYAKKLKSNTINTIETDIARKLEIAHVHDVYDTIALHFSETRCKPWPNILKFLHSLPLGSIVIDVGCGNGKYLGCAKATFCVGCDRSKLIEVCCKKGFEVFTCDCLHIPVRDNVADAIISIAVIHHLANEERRLQSIKEMARVLKVGGRCLIYVWARDQTRDEKETSYLRQNKKNRKERCTAHEQISENVTVIGDVTLPVHVNRTQFQHQDLLVPWTMITPYGDDGESVYLRFYHVFEEGELEALCSQLEYLKIIKSYYDQGNWCCIFEKIQ